MATEQTSHVLDLTIATLIAAIWATPEHPGNTNAATALETALSDEPLPTLRTTYGRALSRKTLIS